MPASYVKPYVKRQKNDATGAEAICEVALIGQLRDVHEKVSETARFMRGIARRAEPTP